MLANPSKHTLPVPGAAGFPEWASVMDGWGHKMLAAVETAAAMLAIGFHLPADAFTHRMAYGPHLLAPTGEVLMC